MEEEFVLVCAKCEVAADDRQNGTAVCPNCGDICTRHEAERARKAVAEQVQYAAAKQLQDTLKQSFRSSRHVTYKPGRLRRPSVGGMKFVYVPKNSLGR